METNKRQILRLTCAAHFLTHFFELLLPAVTMFLYRDLKQTIPGLEPTTVIKVGTMMYLLYGLLALAWGPIADRFGAKLALGLGMLFAGAGYLIAGAATTIPQLWAAFALTGVGIAAYHPAGIALLSKTIKERGRALGINGVWGSLGIAAAPFVGGIGGYYLGWRTLFFLVGALGLVAGVAMFRMQGREHRNIEQTTVESLPANIAVRCFVIMAISMCLSGIIYRANMVTLPIHFEENVGVVIDWIDSNNAIGVGTIEGRGGNSKTLGATLLLTLAYLAGIIGQRIAGQLSDHYDLRWAYLSFWLLAIPGAIGLATLEGIPVMIAAGVFVIFAIGMQPIENSLVARLTPPRWRSTFFGIKFVLVLGLSFVGVYLATYATDRWNSAAVYWIVTGLLVGVIAIVAALIFFSRNFSIHQRQT
jgi:MFS family permease